MIMKQQRVADKFSEQMNSKTGYENFFDGVVAMCDNRVIDNELGSSLKSMFPSGSRIIHWRSSIIFQIRLIAAHI